VSLNASVGPQGQTLRELANTYLDLEAQARRAAEAERERLALTSSAIALTERMRTALEQRNATEIELADLLNRGLVTQQTHDRALADAEQQYRETTEEGKRLLELEQERKKLLEGLLTPQQRYNEQVALLNELLAAGLITQAQFVAGIDAAKRALEGALDRTLLQQFSDGLVQVALSAGDAFVDFAFSAKAAFSDFVKAALRDLARLAVRIAIIAGLTALFPGLGPLLGVGVAARAHGGPVRAGKPYLVGERGPELFVPTMSGSVVANDALAGGGTIRFDVSSLPPRPALMTPEAVATDDWWRRAITHLVLDMRDRGGDI
jgi:hypothetical protein